MFKIPKNNRKSKYSFNNYEIAITKQNYDFIYISLINKYISNMPNSH